MKNKKYKDYEISNIVIEMARDLNSEDGKKAIDKLNKDNKERLEKLIEHHKVDINKIKKGENKIKFLLWCEQGMCDVYDGEYINLDDLLSKPNEYHIDHIIPYTYSFTDSLNNKVLTKATNNHEKGSLTPNQWLSGKGKYHKEYKQRIEKTLDDIGNRMLVSDSKELKQLQNKYKNKKEKFLLYEGEPISDLNGFVNRQLNDTRYISRLFLNNLKDFFNSSKQYKDKKVIINVINGSITNFARNNYFNEKDYQKDEKPDRLLMKKREEYSHHAIDASIICFLGINSKIESLIKNKYLDWEKVTKDDKVCWVNNQTGEVIFDNSNIFKNEEFNKSAKSFEKEMRNYLDKNIKEKFIRFSRMIVSKDNIPLSNETLYSIRKEEKDHKTIYFKITKLDILSTKKDKISNLKKYFGEECKDREKLLCDKNIYDELNKIYLDYLNGNSKNPFINYMESDIIKKELESKNIRTDKVVLNIFNNPIFLRYLRYKDSEINDIKSKFRLKGHNNKAFYDNLNWTSIRLYKDKNGNVLPVYINVLLLKSKNKNGSSILEPDEEKINSILKDKISSNNYIELKRGSCLLKENKLFYVSGGTNNKIEIKYVYKDLEIKTNEKGKVEKKRLFISPEKWNEYKICDVDPLGNVYNIKSVDDIK